MQLNPLRWRRPTTAATDPAPTTTRPPRPGGVSGTINYRGFLQTDEYLTDLQGLKGLQVWDRMLRSDGSVQEAYEHVAAPIKNAQTTVEPPENPDDDELAATQLVSDAFFETLNQPFLEYLEQLLGYLADGFRVFERSWHVVERELTYKVPGEYDVDPDTGKRAEKQVTVASQQWLVWDRFEERLPKTIWQWMVERGRLVEVVQRAWSSDTYTFEELHLDADQLLVVTNKRRGDDFTGRSIFRSAYKAWYMKELVEKIEVVALERWGVGVAIAYPPRSAKQDSAYIARLEDILANLRAGESTYIVATDPKQGTGPNGDEGVLFEILSMSGTPPDFKSPKEYHRAEIKAAVLARFAELGHAQTGARATGDVQSIVWFAALHAVARYLEDAHRPLIKQLVDVNLPGVRRYPKLVFAGIEERDLQQFADAVSKVTSSGAARADSSWRDFVRQTFDAPPEDEIDDSELAVDALGNPIPKPAPVPGKRGQKTDPAQQQLPIESE